MNSNRRYGTWAAEADRASGVLRRSQDGLCCETNSLSRRSGEGQGEGGGLPDRFQAMFSRLSPLPGPLPARSSRGEGEDEAPLALRAFVAYPADCHVAASFQPVLVQSPVKFFVFFQQCLSLFRHVVVPGQGRCE